MNFICKLKLYSLGMFESLELGSLVLIIPLFAVYSKQESYRLENKQVGNM